ncbi:MAG: tetratricopeptide repeat protein [Planctomycetes bacterium]|nr:tetratricopeptide repeat protein [Planctomycetota bacterium]
MRILFAALALALFASGAALAQSDEETALVNSLRDKDPEVRKGAARVLAVYRLPETVEALVKAAQDEKDPAVLKEVLAALRATTNRDEGDDPKKWDEWFDREGGRFEKTISLSARRELSSYRTFLIISIVFNILLFLIVVGGVITFGAMSSNRMKAMKEVTRSAETLIAEGNEVQRKSGGILDGLDSKKSEMMTFFSKLKDENEGEIERYSDMLEQNVEHRMREITMQLREKAEKELEQTFNELKGEIAQRVKSASEEQKEVLIRELTNRQQRFIADVEAHTLFLEASFYYISGKLQDALRVYKKLLALKPDHYIAWNNYGTILRDLLRFDEAMESYQKALDLSPDNAGVLYLFATVYAMQKKKDKMMEYLKRSITFDAEFKDEALNDKAFKEYWEDPEFKDVAEA